MHILRAENYRRMPWKNGGGETAEIAVSPEGAGLDDFGWRVSMARVDVGGPFSMFPGVDRTLSILEGEGIRLDIEGRGSVTLTNTSLPYSFPADAATNADLLGGPIADLNVMTRRGEFRHSVRACRAEGKTDIQLAGAPAMLFCRSGALHISHQDRNEHLGPFDALIVSRPATLQVEGPAHVFTIEFDRI